MSFSLCCLFLSDVFNSDLGKKKSTSFQTFVSFAKVLVLSSVPRERQGGHGVQQSSLQRCLIPDQLLGTGSNALDSGSPVVKQEENVAVLSPPLHERDQPKPGAWTPNENTRLVGTSSTGQPRVQPAACPWVLHAFCLCVPLTVGSDSRQRCELHCPSCPSQKLQTPVCCQQTIPVSPFTVWDFYCSDLMLSGLFDTST